MTATTTEKPVVKPTVNGESSEGRSVEVGKTLASKLANVAREIDRVAKRGRNREQNYDFATAGDIFDEIRSKLASQRVAMRWAIDREATKLDVVESRSGSKGLFATLWITYTFVDGDDGTEWNYYTVGTANDYPGDKAVYKAQTNALKYLLTQTFLVSTGDDVEASSGEQDEHRSATYSNRGGGGNGPTRGEQTAVASNLTPDQQLEVTALNASLPKPYDDKVLAAMAKSGYQAASNALRAAHAKQCTNCDHVAKA